MMIGFLSAFFVASALLKVLLYLRKLVKLMSKKQRNKFLKCTILGDILVIVSFATLYTVWKNVNVMDAVTISLLQGVRAAIIPTFCVIQAYAVIMIGMYFYYRDYELNEEDQSEGK